MRIAYLDCFSGISGDMFMGALVDAGVPLHIFEEAVNTLKIGASLQISQVNRSGITASKVDVVVSGAAAELKKHDHDGSAKHTDEHGHGHAHAHESSAPAPTHTRVQLPEHNYLLESSAGAKPVTANRSHSPTHSDSPAHSHSHSHAHGRGLKQIREIIREAKLSEKAKRNSIAIFEALGAAESKIHGIDIEKVHFHEVGAVDAMVDIVCAAVGAEALEVDEIICSPLNVGGGIVTCAHGVFPVPAPATLELLKDIPVFSSGIQSELVTPTGAAIVKILVKKFAPFPAMRTTKIGYGAGSRDLPGHANVLRMTIGDVESQNAESTDDHGSSDETITVLETNLDDMNPQVFGYVMDRLLEEGALDAFALPAQMKKNRPAMLLTVLCRPQDAERCLRIVLTETTTLGVRYRTESRRTLNRRWVTVATTWGDVRFKVASLNGTVTNYAPEYEDCRKLAAEHHVALKNVMQEAIQGYLKIA